MSDNKAEAGWYPDPHNASQQRYYDGTQWTDHYAPTAGAAPTESWDTPPAGGTYETGTGTLSDIGTMMGAAWSVLMKRIGSLIGITIATGVIAAILVVLLVAVAIASENVGVAILVGLIVMILFIAIYAAYQLMVARIFIGEHRGVSLSIGEAWNQVKGRIVPFVGTIIVVAIVVLIGLGILSAILGAIHPVLLILLLPALAFLWVKLGFLGAAAAATGSGSIFEGSTRVSNGRFWPIFGRLLALAAVAIVWSIIMQVITAAVADSTALVVIVSLISMIGSFLASLFVAAGTTKIYLESGGSTDVARAQV